VRPVAVMHCLTISKFRPRVLLFVNTQSPGSLNSSFCSYLYCHFVFLRPANCYFYFEYIPCCSYHGAVCNIVAGNVVNPVQCLVKYTIDDSL